jgi:hypothetical protein
MVLLVRSSSAATSSAFIRDFYYIPLHSHLALLCFLHLNWQQQRQGRIIRIWNRTGILVVRRIRRSNSLYMDYEGETLKPRER